MRRAFLLACAAFLVAVAGAAWARRDLSVSRKAAEEVFAQPASRFEGGGQPTVTNPSLLVRWLDLGTIRVVRPDGGYASFAVFADRSVIPLSEGPEDAASQAMARDLAFAGTFPDEKAAVSPRAGYRVFYEDPPIVTVNDPEGRTNVTWRMGRGGRVSIEAGLYGGQKNGGTFEAVGYRTQDHPSASSSILRTIPARGEALTALGLEPRGEEHLTFTIVQPRGARGRFLAREVTEVRIEGARRGDVTRVRSDGRVLSAVNGQAQPIQHLANAAQELKKLYERLVEPRPPRPRR